jgi:dimethylargininase
MLTAIVRTPASSLIDACELTFIERTTMNMSMLEAQHLAYRQALAQAGAQVITLEAISDLPDSVFVEDTAVVLDELAVLTRPGSDSRLPEPAHLEPVIAPRRKLERIQAPGTLEGGDVLRVGRTLFVGRSVRTNNEGIAQLERSVRPFGYTVIPVNVTGSLHLKTACTCLDANTLLFNPEWVDAAPFQGFERIPVVSGEVFAANVLPVGSSLLVNAAYPKTLELIRQRSKLSVLPVDISEFGKAEAGLTCMSLIFN